MPVGALVLEALGEVAAAGEVALLEDPGVAALRVGEDLPGVVVAVPEEEAVGAVALGGLGLFAMCTGRILNKKALKKMS